jgi:hypothetical protein
MTAICFSSLNSFSSSLMLLDPVEVCPFSRQLMLPVNSSRIWVITTQLSLFPPSFTRISIGRSCDWLSYFEDRYGLITFRLMNLDGLDPTYPPVTLYLRLVSQEHQRRPLTFLVQAYQHVWLVPHHDGYGGSHLLVIPSDPCSRPLPC